jgi:hypothetical protein
MPSLKNVAMAMMLAALPQVAPAASFITDPIVNPSSQWAGIDYWGVQVSQFSTFDQLLTFTIADDSKIDLFMQGSPKFQFTDILLNGQSIASAFTVDGSTTLKATGYAAAGAVSLQFKGDYTCSDCWGDWFGGYVQVTQASLPVVQAPIPEPASWAMMIGGLALVGAVLRHRKAKVPA